MSIQASYSAKNPTWLHELGPIPDAVITTVNPEYNNWIERCALRLCDDADELGVIPTPCMKHLSEARFIASFNSVKVTFNGE